MYPLWLSIHCFGEAHCGPLILVNKTNKECMQPQRGNFPTFSSWKWTKIWKWLNYPTNFSDLGIILFRRRCFIFIGAKTCSISDCKVLKFCSSTFFLILWLQKLNVILNKLLLEISFMICYLMIRQPVCLLTIDWTYIFVINSRLKGIV